MSNVINYEEKMKDYTGFRPAALKLVRHLREYWNNRGYDPEINLIEETAKNGEKIFSIRSDIHTSGPVKMTPYIKPRVTY